MLVARLAGDLADRQRGADSRELAALTVRLHATLVKQSLHGGSAR